MTTSPSQDWAISGLDLHLELAAGGGIRAGLEEGLRDAIRSGRLVRGTRLPATRSLARDLGISRGTVLAAYTQLAAEGWVSGVRGSGTVVTAEPAPARELPPTQGLFAAWRHDLRPTLPDPSSFPRAEWLRALRRALAHAPASALSYNDPRGLPELRVELAGYLSRVRGLQLAPENVVVTNGFTQALNLLLRAVGARRVAIEDPAIAAHRTIVRNAGCELVLLPVDAEGAQVAALEGSGAEAVVLTPSRQHVVGATLSAARRSVLLDWARSTGALVIENDYDGEFRYDMRPLVALQALEPSHVAYAGTTSKTLAPGLRVGWLVLPDALLDTVADLKLHADAQTASLEQLALAEFLRTGAYDRHIRRQRLRYRNRRDALLRALPPGLPVSGTAAGLNLIVHLPDEATERAVIAAAAEQGVGLFGLISDNYYAGDGPAGLIVGYAAPHEHAFGQAVDALVVALDRV